jgi:hypothetical protein
LRGHESIEHGELGTGDSLSRLRQSLRERQAAWLRRQLGAAATFAPNGYVTQVDHNLFLPLGNLARGEIESGSGKELGSDRQPGKLAAPWSSSALAVNVFESGGIAIVRHWRKRWDVPATSPTSNSSRDSRPDSRRERPPTST